MKDKEEQVQKPLVHKFELEVDLEKALECAGAGRYQVFHCALMVTTLSSALLEMIGSSFILPAAACDLDLPENLRGIITSLPNIGVILTAPFWGRAADTYGRKPVLMMSAMAAGCFGLLAAVMPNLLGYGLCKLAASLFLSCPSSLGFAYAGEMIPMKKRDLAVLICNAILTLSASFSPILAWGILPYDWKLGSLVLRPWRLLTAIYALPLILAGLWLLRAKESPKFLMAKGQHEKALAVLKHIYSVNTKSSQDEYCVTSLRKSAEDGEVADGGSCEQASQPKNQSVLALLRPPHLKWLSLTGFLMFGLFSSLNGLFLFAPDTINKMMSQSTDQDATICMLINQADNTTSTDICVDSISYGTFQIMVVTALAYGAVVLVASLSPLSKKTLLATMFTTVGATCLLSVLTENRLAAGVAMSALQMTALGVGPLTAYTVHLFPTSLRGTAVGAVLMFGRAGSVTGANVAGILLATACEPTFYLFASLLFLCAGLSFLLPKDQPKTTDEDR